MAKNWWKTGLFVMTALFAAGVPVAEGVSANFVDGWDPVSQTHLTVLPDVLLPGGWVIFEFPDPLNSENCPDLKVRLHMDASNPAAVENTLIALSTAAMNSWFGFMGTADGDFISDTAGTPQGTLTASWFDFTISVPVAIFGNVQYVKITNNNAGPIVIDAVEAWPVVVVPPTVGELFSELVASVSVINAEQGINNSLDAKLNSALEAWQDAKANSAATAANKLKALINEAEAQAGKKLITAGQAAELTSLASQIITMLIGT